MVTEDCNYVVSPGNWTALESFWETRNTLDQIYSTEIESYLSNNPGTSQSEASAYALMQTLGDAINLYKAPLNSSLHTIKNRRKQ